jgi:hypothetical protein
MSVSRSLVEHHHDRAAATLLPGDRQRTTMRRIYDSGALRRDDEGTFTPNERDDDPQPRAMRSVPSGTLSRLLVPHRLRYRAVSVEVSTPRERYDAGTRIPFAVTMRNRLPFPVTLPVDSPLPWSWDVDGVPEASHVRRGPPEEEHGFRFDRGERKRFVRRWSGSFRVADDEWEPATPGEYTIGAGLNVADAAERGLYDDVTVRIDP